MSAEHSRPEGVSDVAVEATGKISEALEYVVRARGRLYDLHQLIGRADLLLGEAAELLDRCDVELAEKFRREIVGRNVLEGRWTFQIVEEFDRQYYQPLVDADGEARDRLVGGRRHVYEYEMKQDRHTPGQL